MEDLWLELHVSTGYGIRLLRMRSFGRTYVSGIGLTLAVVIIN
jgi:hypothetical protein